MSPEPSAKDPHVEVSELLDKAVRAQSSRLLKVAVKGLDQVVDRAPENALAYLGRGYALGRLGDDEAAVADLDRAVELAPQDPGTYTVRGRYRLRRRDFDGARADLDRAAYLAPEEPAVYLDRAGLAAAEGDFAGSLADYSRAIELGPESASGYRRRGALLETLGRYEEALADYEQVIALGDGSAHAYRNRADAHGALDQFDEAIADYRRAIKLEPELVGAHLGLARMLSLTGRHKVAIRSFNAAIKLDPTLVEAYRLRALEHEALGNLPKALADLNQAIEADQGLDAAYVARGRIYRRLGQPADGLQDFDIAVALNPSSADGLAGRADALVALGDPEAAEADYGRALELDPAHLGAWDGLAMAHLRHGDRLSAAEQVAARRDEYRQALEASYRGLERFPDHLPFRGYGVTALRLLDAYDWAFDSASELLGTEAADNAVYRAWLLPELGESQRQWGELLRVPERLRSALEAFDKGLADTSAAEDRAVILELKGHTHSALAENEPALECFQSAVEIHPDAIWAQLGRGRVFLRCEEFEDALGAFERALEIDPASSLAGWARTGRWLSLVAVGDAGASGAAGDTLGAGRPEDYLERAEHLEFFDALERSLDDRRRAADLAPKLPEALNALAWFYADHGGGEQLDEGLALAMRALDVLGPSDPARANCADTAGWLAHRAGLGDEAVKWLRHAVELDEFPLLYRWHLRQVEGHRDST